MKPRIYAPKETNFTNNGLGVLSKATKCYVTEEANGKYEVEIEYPLKSRFADYFVNGYQIKVKPNDQEEYHVFEIKNTYQDTFSNSILIYGQSRTYKLGNREVQHVEITSQNGAGAMLAIEKGMDEPSDVKLYSDIQTNSSTLFEARNVLNCIAGEQGSMLQYWGGEIKREPFKLSLLARRGRNNVGIVRYGKDLNGLKIKFDWSSIITKVLPYADIQNDNDGTTNRVYGTAVYSDLATNYPDVYAYHIQFTEDQGVTDLTSLDRVAKTYFKSINPDSDKPKVSIELEIEKLSDSEEAKEFSKLRNYGLFDTFTVYHKLYNIHIETRITSVVYDSINEKNIQIYAGDSRMAFYTKQNYELQEVIKTLTKKGYMSEFVDYITNLINGVEGGSVLQYPKNKPHSTYYLDTDSVETAKDVVVHNNKGIGFSRTGWKGPFIYGWTIDGVLNADFISAGTLKAIDIIGVNISGSNIKGTNIEGSTIKSDDANFEIKMANGIISFFDKQAKKEIGAIVAAYAENQVRGFTFLQKYGYDLAIGTQSPDGKYHSNVLEVPKDSNYDSPKLNLYGEVRLKGKLFLNGQEITPGGTGGGGGWNGDYPPEITTQAEKFAWQAWVTLLSMGYSKEAAAGILGNIQGEAGPSMNPDTEQIGGPAYGAIQFDGSAYPLIGPPTNNGREYFQRLHTASGVGGDYREMAPQMKVVNWAMTNGQWIGAVDPTTVGGFKGINSPEQAAYAFEKNFERPASAHPERQGWAREWYNKFKDLVQPSGNYGFPVLAGTPVTSWFGPRWGTMHNGIDFGGVVGDPIFAAQSGTVVYSYSDPDMGEWVVIKHDNDAYMTGYAHNSARLVNVGDKVSKGQQIARMGSTGDSTGPHLHFAVQTEKWSGYVDPAPFLGLTPP